MSPETTFSDFKHSEKASRTFDADINHKGELKSEVVQISLMGAANFWGVVGIIITVMGVWMIVHLVLYRRWLQRRESLQKEKKGKRMALFQENTQQGNTVQIFLEEASPSKAPENSTRGLKNPGVGVMLQTYNMRESKKMKQQSKEPTTLPGESGFKSPVGILSMQMKENQHEGGKAVDHFHSDEQNQEGKEQSNEEEKGEIYRIEEIQIQTGEMEKYNRESEEMEAQLQNSGDEKEEDEKEQEENEEEEEEEEKEDDVKSDDIALDVIVDDTDELEFSAHLPSIESDDDHERKIRATKIEEPGTRRKMAQLI